MKQLALSINKTGVSFEELIEKRKYLYIISGNYNSPEISAGRELTAAKARIILFLHGRPILNDLLKIVRFYII